MTERFHPYSIISSTARAVASIRDKNSRCQVACAVVPPSGPRYFLANKPKPSFVLGFLILYSGIDPVSARTLSAWPMSQSGVLSAKTPCCQRSRWSALCSMRVSAVRKVRRAATLM
jgi:hypothetical protein